MASMGRTRAVGLVTWLMRASRVRGVTARRTASTTRAGSSRGKGSRAITTRAPDRSATKRSALRAALYSWSRLSSSSPGSNRRERRTVFSPVVAFGTKARSSGSAPTNLPSAVLASARRSVELPAEEPDRLGLEPIAEGRLDREHLARARPERAVVEERDPRIEGPARTGIHRRRVPGAPVVASAGSRVDERLLDELVEPFAGDRTVEADDALGHRDRLERPALVVAGDHDERLVRVQRPQLVDELAPVEPRSWRSEARS